MACEHRVPRTPKGRGVLAGDCEKCGTFVLANGCGPGWIEHTKVGPDRAWLLMDDGKVWWFGPAEQSGEVQ
jgi:hypothetical protein